MDLPNALNIVLCDGLAAMFLPQVLGELSESKKKDIASNWSTFDSSSAWGFFINLTALLLSSRGRPTLPARVLPVLPGVAFFISSPGDCIIHVKSSARGAASATAKLPSWAWIIPLFHVLAVSNSSSGRV